MKAREREEERKPDGAGAEGMWSIGLKMIIVGWSLGGDIYRVLELDDVSDPREDRRKSVYTG